MAIPDYQSVFLPLLAFAGDGKEHSLREAYETLGSKFGLSEEELKTMLPSGRQPIFQNRIGWAKTYMEKAGLFKKPRRGYFLITERGKDVLKKGHDRLSVRAPIHLPIHLPTTWIAP